MQLLKYRDLSRGNPEEFRRLEIVLQDRAFWCARPDTLNDPEEFSWLYDYTASDATAELLAALISQSQQRSLEHSREMAATAISNEWLVKIAAPIIASIIEKCRNEIGLACFATSPNTSTLWERYGGNGVGVCVEAEVPDDLLGSELYEVQYFDEKVIHIDQLVRAALNTRNSREVFTLSLLCKSKAWEAEAEVRFVSKQQNVLVAIDRSRITGVWLGARLDWMSRSVVERIIRALPYGLQIYAA